MTQRVASVRYRAQICRYKARFRSRGSNTLTREEAIDGVKSERAALRKARKRAAEIMREGDGDWSGVKVVALVKITTFTP